MCVGQTGEVGRGKIKEAGRGKKRAWPADTRRKEM